MARVTAYVPDHPKQLDGRSRKRPQLVGTRPTDLDHSSPIPSSQNTDLPDIANVIERLRRSKNDFDIHEFLAGLVAGDQWAKQKADYRELKKAAEYNVTRDDDPLIASDVFLRAVGVGPRDRPGFWKEVGYSGRGKPCLNFLRGFCKGAQTVFEEVVDRL